MSMITQSLWGIPTLLYNNVQMYLCYNELHTKHEWMRYTHVLNNNSLNLSLNDYMIGAHHRCVQQEQHA